MVLRLVCALALFGLLTACGADGPPIRPEPKDRSDPPARSGGVTIGGSASLGVKYTG